MGGLKACRSRPPTPQFTRGGSALLPALGALALCIATQAYGMRTDRTKTRKLPTPSGRLVFRPTYKFWTPKSMLVPESTLVRGFLNLL